MSLQIFNSSNICTFFAHPEIYKTSQNLPEPSFFFESKDPSSTFNPICALTGETNSTTFSDLSISKTIKQIKSNLKFYQIAIKKMDNMSPKIEVEAQQSSKNKISSYVAKTFVEFGRYFAWGRYCGLENKKSCLLFFSTKPETLQTVASTAFAPQNIFDKISSIFIGFMDDGDKLTRSVVYGNYYLPKLFEGAFDMYLDIRARLD